MQAPRSLRSLERDEQAPFPPRSARGIEPSSPCWPTRVGEVARLRVGDYKTTGGHRVLEVYGKGGKERRVPLHPEAAERLETWLDVAGIRDDAEGPLFRAALTARAEGRDGFRATPLTRRAIQYLVKRYAQMLGLDPAVTVHSFRVPEASRGCAFVPPLVLSVPRAYALRRHSTSHEERCPLHQRDAFADPYSA